MSENLTFHEAQGVATLTFNRPEKLNAFTDDMLEACVQALEACRCRDDIRVIVLTGAGQAFTTGGDVGGFAASASKSAAEITAHLASGIQRLQRKIAEIDKPIIAALNGIAVGGGLDIALACDIRFAAESARFAETYVRMGLIPGAGGAWLLPRIVGAAKALEMFWTAGFVDAREALRIGLVNEVFADEDFVACVHAFACRIAEGAPLAVQLIKRITRLGQSEDFDGGLELAAANMPIVRLSEDHQEAVAAFKEKRPPVFKGR